MKTAIAAVVCLVVGWLAHGWWAEHNRALPSVTVTVTPPSASAPKVTHPASLARKPEATPAARQGAYVGNGHFSYGVLDTYEANGYVTPGIGYYPPPL